MKSPPLGPANVFVPRSSNLCHVHRHIPCTISHMRLLRSSGCGRVVGLDHTILRQWGRSRSFRVDVFLARAVNGDLDSDLTSVNLFAIHLVDCLLLHLLRSKRDESKTTTLARLVACLKLLDHEARDWTESDLGGRRLVS